MCYCLLFLCGLLPVLSVKICLPDRCITFHRMLQIQIIFRFFFKERTGLIAGSAFWQWPLFPLTYS